MGTWTDEEISTLVSMWPSNSVMLIAARLNRQQGSDQLAAELYRLAQAAKLARFNRSAAGFK